MAAPASDMTTDISIHAPREGSDDDKSTEDRPIKISIHAPREGSDLVVVVDEVGLFGISIHAPREGSDRQSL